MKSGKISEIKNPDRIKSYFGKEWAVLLVVTVSGIIYNAGMAAGPFFEGQLTQCLYEIIKGTGTKQKMYILVLCYVGVIFLVQLMRALKRYFVRIFSNNVSRNMRHTLYNSLVRMDSKQLEKENLGTLMTKAISDVDACAEGMRKFTTEVFDTGVVMVVYMGLLFWYDWRLTLIACAFTPFAYFFASRLKKTVSAANSSYKHSASRLNSMTMDRISNALTYRIFGREDDRNENYEKHLSDYEHKSAKANVLESSMAPLYDAVSMLGAILILYFGSRNVTGCGWKAWNIAAFTTYLSCFTKLAIKAGKAAKLFNSVQKAKVSWNRIKPLMKKTVHEKELEYSEKPLPAQLELSGVKAGYEDFSIKDIVMNAEPGDVIGVTGIVASGKSIFGKIFIGETPASGLISINKKEMKDMNAEEKSLFVSYMGHECELISSTIRENISLGDDVDVWKWLKMVCLDKEVAALPEKEDTFIGSSGMMLSGGQQARLALARTLCHGKSILVLDDPFSAVDKNTETEILKNLEEYRKDRIIILISHRLYHFPEFSHVVFLKDGKAVWSTHSQLMREEKEYAGLFERQMKGDDLDEE